MRNKINHVLFKHYSKWAVGQAYLFKKKYSRGTYNINPQDLSFYTLNGLWCSIQEYNCSYPFQQYLKIKLHYNLLHGYTKMQPITLVPERIRRRKNEKKKRDPFYNNRLQPILYGTDDFLIDNNQEKMNVPFETAMDKLFYIDVWKVLYHTQDSSSFSLLQMKYDFYFNKINSNKKIANILGRSEESVRVKFSKIKMEEIYTLICTMK